MKRLKRLRLLVVDYWRPAIVAVAAFTLVAGLLWFKLGELPGGISQTEDITRQHLLKKDVSFTTILDNPLFLPHSIALYILQLFNVSTLGALRSISTFIGGFIVLAFYLLVRKWHTTRMAVLGTILFATSSWFLHIARLGSTDILFSVLIVFLLTGIWLQHSRNRSIFLAILTLTGVMTLYIPGMVWFVLLGFIWQRNRLVKEFKYASVWFISFLVVGIILLLAPLVWSLIQSPQLIKPLLGLPETFPSLAVIGRNILTIPVRLLLRGPNDPTVWLGRLPLLDFFSSVMMIIGMYWYLARVRLERTLFIVGVFMVGTILLAIQGPLNLAFFLPFVYLLVTAGMTFMLQQWFTVFPRNPIARTIGTTLLTICVLVTAFYHINHYFIAWPNTPETRQVYKPFK